MVAASKLTPSEVHSNAVRLAGMLDYHVFPAHTVDDDLRCTCGRPSCPDIGKHPDAQLAPRGLLNATNDPNEVDRFWQSRRNANIAVRTGAESGIIVVDIDPRHGGWESLAELEGELGPLPTDGPRAQTGGGGAHLVFAHPGRYVRTRAKVALGLDIRGDGGYFIATPSRHASGRHYEWLVGHSPFEVDPAELPARWIEFLCRNHSDRPSTSTTRVGDFELTADQIVALVAILAPYYIEGQRHELTLAIAGWLGMQQYTEETTATVIERLGFGDSELRSRLRNVVSTFNRLADGESVLGWNRLKELLHESTLKAIEGLVGTYPRLVVGAHRASTNGTAPPGEPPIDDEPLDEAAGDDLPPPPPNRPAIDAGNQDLEFTSARAWEALQAANVPERLFRFGGDPVRIQRSEDDALPYAQTLSEDRLSHELARAAIWFKQPKEGKPKPAAPPPRVIKDMLAAPEIPLPPLRSIVQTPVFAADGSIQTAPGYHPAGRSYYAPDPGFFALPVPEHPTSADLERAKALILDDLLGDFPFISEAERANAVALVLDRYLRDMIAGGTPLRMIEAPMPGSGKGLLADVALRPAIGERVHVMPAAEDESEWQKRLTASLCLVPAAIVIDNIVKTLNSGSLSSTLTASWWTNRRLGTNEMVSFPVRCTWLATANNPTMSTELARRTVRIRLDPKVDRPWQRTGFKHGDLRSWVDEHRAELVWASLVLGRHWIAEGMPKGTVPLGSFEHWAVVMGGVLGAAGIEGFLANRESFYEEADTEGATWRQFVGIWFEKHGEAEVGVAELFGIASNVEGFDFGKGSERSQKVTFGKMLGQQRDRVVGDFRVINTRTVQRAKHWRLIKNKGGDNPFATFYTDTETSG